MTEVGSAAAFGKDAFALAEALDSMTTVDEVMDETGRILRPLGYTDFACADIVRADQPLDDRVWAYRASEEWLKLYLENNYVHHDPTIRKVRSATHPFRYGDAQFDAEAEPRAREIMRLAHDFGITDGTIVPISHGSVCRGAAWFGGKTVDKSLALMPLLHFLGVYTFHRIRALTAPARKLVAHLTPREREVLTWTANGKSAWAIGEILGISMRTVNEHAQTAAHKLGASNRTQAVALALHNRLISL